MALKITENIEINNIGLKLKELGTKLYYCSVHQDTSSNTTTGSSWSNPVMTLGTFATNNNNIFELNNNKIKIKKEGTYLIFRNVGFSNDPNLNERDLTTFVGSTRITNYNWQNNASQILVSSISAKTEIYFSINTSYTSITTSSHDILIIKIS